MKMLLGYLSLAAALTVFSGHAFALAGINGKGLNGANLNSIPPSSSSTIQVDLNALQIESIELAD